MHPTDGRIVSVEVDDSMTAAEAIVELMVNNFMTSDEYSLQIMGGNLIRENQTFLEAKVQENDTIRVIHKTSAGGMYIASYYVLHFIEWITEINPNINPLTSIPVSELENLISAFMKTQVPKSSVSYYSKNLKETLIARKRENSFIPNIISKLYSRKKSTPENIFSLERYKSIEYHGIFIYTFLDNEVQSLVLNGWKDINALTRDYLDVYFSKKDLETKCGHDILHSFHQIDSSGIILPIFLLWHKRLSNSIVIPLNGLDKKQIFDALQYIVSGIRQGMTKNEVRNFVQEKMRELTSKPTYQIKGNVMFIQSQSGEIHNSPNYEERE